MGALRRTPLMEPCNAWDVTASNLMSGALLQLIRVRTERSQPFLKVLMSANDQANLAAPLDSLARPLSLMLCSARVTSLEGANSAGTHECQKHVDLSCAQRAATRLQGHACCLWSSSTERVSQV